MSPEKRHRKETVIQENSTYLSKVVHQGISDLQFYSYLLKLELKKQSRDECHTDTQDHTFVSLLPGF